jgi:hypothetical protein
MKRSNISLTAFAVALTMVVAPGASAGKYDGSANLVCSTVGVVACTTRASSCIRAHTSDFDLPDFLFVDLENKVVRATEDNVQTETSPIKSSERSEHQLLLQGFENDQGWTLAIARDDGQMTLTSTGPDVSFMIFGACTTL